MNLCQELRCPFALKTGCDRFTVSDHCPIAYLEPGKLNPEIRPNQYWLFADDTADVDITALRSELDQQVLTSESSQLALSARRRFGENPIMVWA